MELHAVGGEPGDEAVLLLHGFGADRQAWTGILSAVASRALALAPDLPGHGSAMDEPFVSFDVLVETLLATLEADPRWAGATRRHVVGHSVGGALALALAARAERPPTSLALLAPLGLADDVDVGWLRALVRLEDDAAANRHLSRLVENPRLMPDQVGRTLVRRLERPGVRDTLDAIVDAIETLGATLETDVRHAVERDPPRLVLWGERDTISRPSDESLARFGGEREILPGCGHLPHVERRVETSALLDALTARAAGRPVPGRTAQSDGR